MNVIIVHEKIIIRKKLRQAIEEQGHKVIGESINGVQAYNCYVTLNPHVIFLNIDMPIYNGRETIKKILNYNPKAFCVILSQKKDNRRVFELLELGAKHFLTLPFESKDVLKLLEDIKKMKVEMEI